MQLDGWPLNWLEVWPFGYGAQSKIKDECFFVQKQDSVLSRISFLPYRPSTPKVDILFLRFGDMVLLKINSIHKSKWQD